MLNLHTSFLGVNVLERPVKYGQGWNATRKTVSVSKRPPVLYPGIAQWRQGEGPIVRPKQKGSLVEGVLTYLNSPYHKLIMRDRLTKYCVLN